MFHWLKTSFSNQSIFGKILVILLICISSINFYKFLDMTKEWDISTSHLIYSVSLFLYVLAILHSYSLQKDLKLYKEINHIVLENDKKYEESIIVMYEILLKSKEKEIQ